MNPYSSFLEKIHNFFRREKGTWDLWKGLSNVLDSEVWFASRFFFPFFINWANFPWLVAFVGNFKLDTIRIYRIIVKINSFDVCIVIETPILQYCASRSLLTVRYYALIGKMKVREVEKAFKCELRRCEMKAMDKVARDLEDAVTQHNTY